MQAVGLATGDEFLVRYNLTIDTGDVLDYLGKLFVMWNDLSFKRVAHFDNTFGVDFTILAGPGGFCYNFNLVDAEDLLNLDL
jgi:hypothetical protein